MTNSSAVGGSVYDLLPKLSKPELIDLALTAHRLAGERVFLSVGVEDLREMIADTDLAGATDEQLQQAVDYAWKKLDCSDELSAAKRYALNQLEAIVNDAN